MRRSSLFFLAGAVVLGLLAVMAVNNAMRQAEPASNGPAVVRTYVVVAAAPLKFSDPLTPAALRLLPWPGEKPAGSYSTVAEAVGDGTRVALRNIAEGEVLLEAAISGEAGRLASSAMLGPDMRAISVPIDEVSSVGGFVAPGDRVDVLVSQNNGQEASYTAVVVQGVRVLAVGQNQDTTEDEPRILESATLEVTPLEAQRVALAQTTGKLSLALRGTGDESRIPTHVVSSQDIYGARAVAAPAQASAPSVPSAPAAPRVVPAGNEVRVVRGTETTSYQVSR